MAMADYNAGFAKGADEYSQMTAGYPASSSAEPWAG